MDTRWTCGPLATGERSGWDCAVEFNLYQYRYVRQIQMGKALSSLEAPRNHGCNRNTDASRTKQNNHSLLGPEIAHTLVNGPCRGKNLWVCMRCVVRRQRADCLSPARAERPLTRSASGARLRCPLAAFHTDDGQHSEFSIEAYTAMGEWVVSWSGVVRVVSLRSHLKTHTPRAHTHRRTYRPSARW